MPGQGTPGSRPGGSSTPSGETGTARALPANGAQQGDQPGGNKLGLSIPDALKAAANLMAQSGQSLTPAEAAERAMLAAQALSEGSGRISQMVMDSGPSGLDGNFPAALLGDDAVSGDWARFRGTLDTDAQRRASRRVPREYEQRVEHYFRDLGEAGAAE